MKRTAAINPLGPNSKPLARGFTLIELTVVVAVLSLLAAAIMPNLASFERGRQLRSFLTNLPLMAARAREMAISYGYPVDLEYDDGANQLVIHSKDQNGDDQTLSTLALPSGFSASRFMLGQNESDGSSWKLAFYPDGTSDGGGLELRKPDNTILSLHVFANDGRSELLNDSLPDPKQDSWPAGDYVHRT